MKIFLIIAWRNILRNKRRSLITIFSVGFGLGAIIFLWGYIDGAHLQLKENFTGLFTGHLQIHARGFEETRALTRVVKDPTTLEEVLRKQPGIDAYTSRIRAYVFLRTPAGSLNGLVVGIDPTQEPKVTKIGLAVHRGRLMKGEETGYIVLGESMADNLKINMGGKTTIMVQGPGGSVKSRIFKVIGTVKTGVEDIDKGMALVTLEDAQALLGLGKAVTDVVVRTNNLSSLDEMKRSLEKQLTGDNLEILTWSEMAPLLQQWINFDEAFAYVFLLIVLVVIIAGMLNTILMSMLERTREFGVMLALGTKGYQLAFMMGLESFLLGLVGLAAGITLGFASIELFARLGVPVGADIKQALAAFFISDVVYPTLGWKHIFFNGLIVFCCCVLISLYPAWKVSKLRPAVAMRRP
jgi:putative ABC transport system permease protein